MEVKILKWRDEAQCEDNMNMGARKPEAWEESEARWAFETEN